MAEPSALRRGVIAVLPGIHVGQQGPFRARGVLGQVAEEPKAYFLFDGTVAQYLPDEMQDPAADNPAAGCSIACFRSARSPGDDCSICVLAGQAGVSPDHPFRGCCRALCLLGRRRCRRAGSVLLNTT